MCSEGLLVLVIVLIPVDFQVAHMLLELGDLVLQLLPVLLHFNAVVALLDQFIEVLFPQASNVVFLIVVDFFLLLFFENGFYSLLVHRTEWVKCNYLVREFLLSLGRFSNANNRLLIATLLNEVDDLLVVDIRKHPFQFFLLLLDGGVAFHLVF